MSDALRMAQIAGVYAIDREAYLADMRAAFDIQTAELEAMLERARTAQEAAPSELGAGRLRAFEAGIEQVRRKSGTILAAIPDPLDVRLELAREGTFRMQIRAPGGDASGSGTWSLRGEAVVLCHARGDGRPLEVPVTEELAIQGEALEKRASGGHFPFRLRRAT